ncbi:hypothetical protein Syun_012613 [Stephania yunnanensis]|uniref:Uncharacterized protein n=1 Tax=Stephania yunnanensis TaxID=152371 RepID=A0AAP0PFH8_9MAGN
MAPASVVLTSIDELMNQDISSLPTTQQCGYIRKLVSGASDANLVVIEVRDIPGGDEAFELAAKLCYGINFEISIDNIAMLCCVVEYLEMTEDNVVGNLVSRMRPT